MDQIPLEQLIRIEEPHRYKLHAARKNDVGNEPLDIFVGSRSEWLGWNRWRNTKNEFNREFIFSLIDFYPEHERWLFGGIFEVLERRPVTGGEGYVIRELEQSKEGVDLALGAAQELVKQVRLQVERMAENSSNLGFSIREERPNELIFAASFGLQFIMQFCRVYNNSMKDSYFGFRAYRDKLRIDFESESIQLRDAKFEPTVHHTGNLLWQSKGGGPKFTTEQLVAHLLEEIVAVFREVHDAETKRLSR